eukprot:IDg8201t1
MRIWCGGHQLEFCMQAFYLAMPEDFYKTLTLCIAYLRRQQNFLTETRSQCSLVCSTRWINMIKVTKGFNDYRLDVHGLFMEKKLSCRPNSSLWFSCTLSTRLWNGCDDLSISAGSLNTPLQSAGVHPAARH